MTQRMPWHDMVHATVHEMVHGTVPASSTLTAAPAPARAAIMSGEPPESAMMFGSRPRASSSEQTWGCAARCMAH